MSPAHRPEYLGDPTLAQVMRRPRWILALLLALAVAAGFAWLGQWQLGSAIRTTQANELDTETPTPLEDLAQPGTATLERTAGYVTTTSGSLDLESLLVVGPRTNDDATGVWVVGHMVNDQGNLAVAIAWAPSAAAAAEGIRQLQEHATGGAELAVEGRYMPPEGTVIPEGTDDPKDLQSMVPAQLINVWSDVTGESYAGYLVLHDTQDGASLIRASGLEVIDSVPPLPPEQINWLNLFYAIEWAVFALFAVFVWVRLARDAWEREHEFQELAAEEATSAPPVD